MSTLKKQIFSKALKFCAYRERCHQEIRKKLRELGADEYMAEELIMELLNENFINEERFAIEFALSKIRLKNWGKIKTAYELKLREISNRNIDTALAQIEEEEYINILERLLIKKLRLLNGSEFEKKIKASQYAFNKGFESNLISSTLEMILKN